MEFTEVLQPVVLCPREIVCCMCVCQSSEVRLFTKFHEIDERRNLPECGFSFSSRRDRRICGRQNCQRNEWRLDVCVRVDIKKITTIKKDMYPNEATNSCEQKTVFCFFLTRVCICVCVCASVCFLDSLRE